MTEATRRDRGAVRLKVVPSAKPGAAGRPEASEDIDERIERVKAALYDLYDGLRAFATGAVEDRERLRESVSWPDVGHVTSLARALAEEDRFADWVRFNRMIDRAGLESETYVRERSA